MKTLRPYLALYRKEMKSIRGIGIALCVIILSASLVAQIGWNLYILRRYRHLNLELYHFSDLITSKLVIIEYSGPYILAVLLGYTFFIERKTRTDYLLLSLPVNRGIVIAGKLFAVLSYAILISFGEVFNLIIIPALIFHVPRTNYYRLYFFYNIDLVWIPFIKNLWCLNGQYFIILSMTTVAIGVMHMVKSQRILIAVCVFILLHGVYLLTYSFTLSPFDEPSLLYCFIEGIILSLIGFYLYQKHAEV